jgi:hypothetical protein
MKVFIKENSIVTEWQYSKELETILIEEGFTSIKVPDMNDENPYKYEDFELVNGVWKLK